MSPIFRKIYRALKQYKFGIIWMALNRLLPEHFRYRTFVLYTYDLKKLLSDTREKREDVTFRKIESADDEWFAAYREIFPDPEFKSRIREKNKTCFLALKEGEVAGYAWVSVDKLFIGMINHTYQLKSGELFIYACYVRAKFRGQGIYPDMLRAILAEFHRREFRRAYIGVLSANTGSRRGIEKCGFSIDRKIRYVRLPGMEKWWGVKRSRLWIATPVA